MTRYDRLKQNGSKAYGRHFTTKNLNPVFLYAFCERQQVTVGFADSKGKVKYLSTGYVEVTEDNEPNWLLVRDRVSGHIGQPIGLQDVLIPVAVAREMSRTVVKSSPNQLRRVA